MNNKTLKRDIKFRKIAIDDLKFFLKWWKDKELIKLTSGVTEKNDDVLKTWFEQMRNSKIADHYMILYKKHTVGHIFLVKRLRDRCELSIIIGEKDYWHKGIGRIAIDKILAIGFNKHKYNMCYLEVRPENQRAINCYLNSGFKKMGFKKYPENKYRPITLKMSIKK